jgi:hypothetical protein
MLRMPHIGAQNEDTYLSGSQAPLLRARRGIQRAVTLSTSSLNRIDWGRALEKYRYEVELPPSNQPLFAVRISFDFDC